MPSPPLILFLSSVPELVPEVAPLSEVVQPCLEKVRRQVPLREARLWTFLLSNASTRLLLSVRHLLLLLREYLLVRL